MARRTPSSDEAHPDVFPHTFYPFLQGGHFAPSGCELPLYAYLFHVCHSSAAKTRPVERVVAGRATHSSLQPLGRVGVRSGTVAGRGFFSGPEIRLGSALLGDSARRGQRFVLNGCPACKVPPSPMTARRRKKGEGLSARPVIFAAEYFKTGLCPLFWHGLFPYLCPRII